MVRRSQSGMLFERRQEQCPEQFDVTTTDNGASKKMHSKMTYSTSIIEILVNYRLEGSGQR